MNCRHEKFEVSPHVEAFNDRVGAPPHRWELHIKQIVCTQCGAPFRLEDFPIPKFEIVPVSHA